MFKDLVKKSRSYRGYDASRKITREELLDLVDCSRFAPSSVNRQPFQYLLVYEQADLDKIQPLTGWARGLPQMKLPHPGKCPAAFIVICQNTDWDPDLNRYLRDVGIAAQTMLLAAAEKDLVDISSRQLAAPNGIRIEEPLIDRQLGSVVPSEIPKIPTHPNTTIEDKLPVVQLTNNMIDQKDRDIDGLVSNALNI